MELLMKLWLRYQYQLLELFRFRIVSLKSRARRIIFFFDAPIAGRPLTGLLLADKQIEQDYFIAGGFDWPRQCGRGQRAFHPYALDVSSGVRDRWAQDLDKIKSIYRRVKAWHINNLMQRILWKIRWSVRSKRWWQPLLGGQGLSWGAKEDQVSGGWSPQAGVRRLFTTLNVWLIILVGHKFILNMRDITHTGAKINNALGQVLLAKRMGSEKMSSRKLVQVNTVLQQRQPQPLRHGLARLWVRKMLNVRHNVFRMELLGARYLASQMVRACLRTR